MPLVRADAPITIDWIGAGDTPSAVDGGNWVAPGEPPVSPYVPNGYENFQFGKISFEGTEIYIPVMLDEGEQPIPVPVQDLFFSNLATDGFNFSFSGNSAEDSRLYLLGNVTLESNGSVNVNDNLAFLLSRTSHSVTIGEDSTLSIAAPIFEYDENEGAASIDKWGAGTLVLNSSYSDFIGGVTVHEGALAIGASSSIEYYEGDAYNIVSGPLGTGTVKFETNGTTPGLALADSGSYTLHNHFDLGCFEGTVKIDTGCGDLTLAGYIDGTAGITKVGDGVLTLSGNENSFNGDVTIDGGTVKAAGNFTLGYGEVVVNSGGTLQFAADYQDNRVTVNEGGTLSGNGYTYEAIIKAGGTLSPGTAYCPIGTLNFDDLTLEGLSTLVIGIKEDGEGGLESSQVHVMSAATLTLSGVDSEHKLTLKLISEGVLANLSVGEVVQMDFLTYDGIQGGTLVGNVDFDLSDFETAFEGYNLSLVQNAGIFSLQFTPVPEPSTYVLMVLGAGLTGFAAWRKRRQA